MSINMADVKQIMYGNKEVTKIEDSLGNILWQKEVAVDPYLIYIGDGKYYKLDMVNKTTTALTVTGGANFFVGNKVFAYAKDAWHLSWWSGSIQKELIIDLDKNTLIFDNHNAWPSKSAYDSNYTYSVTGPEGYNARISRNSTDIDRSFYVLQYNSYVTG